MTIGLLDSYSSLWLFILQFVIPLKLMIGVMSLLIILFGIKAWDDYFKLRVFWKLQLVQCFIEIFFPEMIVKNTRSSLVEDGLFFRRFYFPSLTVDERSLGLEYEAFKRDYFSISKIIVYRICLFKIFRIKF